MTVSPNPAVLERPRSIKLLTGVRFFLAFYVVVFHVIRPQLSGLPDPVIGFFSSGFSAVSIFFALSGYVLAYNHIDGRPVELRRFWIARLARLLPAFLFSEGVCLLAIVLSAHHDHSSTVRLLRSLAIELGVSFGFLQGWLFPIAINMAAWSLSCEVFFYLVFPAIAVPFARLTRVRLQILATILIAMSLIAPLLYLILQPDGVPLYRLTERALTFPNSDPAVAVLNNALWHTMSYRFFLFFPIVHLPVFLLGAAMGRYRRAYLPLSKQLLTQHRRWLSLTCLALLLVLFFSASVPHILLHNSVVGVLACICFLFAESAPRPLRSFLEARPILFLGEASYALYILQLPCAIFWEYVAEHFHRPELTRSFLGSLLFMALIISLSCLVYEFVERPFRLRIRKLAYGGIPMA